MSLCEKHKMACIDHRLCLICQKWQIHDFVEASREVLRAFAVSTTGHVITDIQRESLNNLNTARFNVEGK